MKHARTALALSASVTLLAGLSAANQPDAKPSASRVDLDRATSEALDGIVVEMQRRFHDRTDVDFGFSRIFRPHFRQHRGPFMRRGELGLPPASARAASGANRSVNRGQTVVNPGVQLMEPENANERRLLRDLAKAKEYDFAVYTFGGLDLSTELGRGRGPGYLTEPVASAPGADVILGLARRMWQTQAAATSIAAPNGWKLLGRRVVADDAQCVQCHGRNGSLKVGEGVGLLVVAYRRIPDGERGTL